MSDDPGPTPPLLAAAVRCLKARRDQLALYTAAVEGLLTELADDVGTLGAQEAWEPAVVAGMSDWACDRGNVFRALRRAHFDDAKAHAALLACCAARIERGLSGAIPPPPAPGLFAMLPLSQTDRLGHPVAVLTIRDVVRDEAGSLAELKDWVWFGLEMVRRVLADYWVAHRHGTGAEGAVLLIDAKDAGYRNLEVEVLPTLFSVGHNSFPGLFESVYIVNAGWSHRTMWNSIVKRLLPKSALDKVVFLESKDQTAQVFNLDQLPTAYGGNGHEPDPEIMLRRYSIARPHPYSRPGSRAASRAPSRGPSRAVSRAASRAGSRAPSRDPPRRAVPSRTASTSSIADVYYTAPPSPARSRPPSRRNSSHTLSGLSNKLAMTKQGGDVDFLSEQQMLVVDTNISTTQRIKSLSDFHLYLSPSRLAHRDLLSDSEDDEPPPQPIVQRRRTLRPAMLELGAGSIAARRAARVGVPTPARASTPAEYATMLQAHHARGLEQYYSPEQHEVIEAMSSPEHSDGPESPQSPLAIEAAPEDDGEQAVNNSSPSPEPEPEHEPECKPQQILAPTPVRPAEAEAPDVQFSSSNPWFGYPVVRVPHATGDGYAIRPRYGRNRKRDLAKTLLWLFVLRLQAWRSAVERALGLPRLAALLFPRKHEEHATPDQGLRAVARTRAYAPKTAVVKRDRDWIWMVIGFLLLRGTWARLLGPLENMGLGVLRDLLGLV
ncbi:hypothetical protein CC85DRAFT_284115 [Cutaneotrichosporon oleaginosum]|uniref:CRAL-TRIO domain-containing protein n=1 Tax=Cutaneotrichosporon oleaginosum TaxID=879819 RepID=A0A0J0XRX9_9TREE|nr:uncharacterized protein CC85DRAFT_284115 [Cutaneotrichosporon oleaginosum]KLT43830.1 hypothetical protein CC85DRAFT_284115 [Cutaneotrichosporon oleaginosum]TXT06429.1 hypothetical protein COLE_05760 [Cutaneotrichosporon oleaginosum]